MKIEEHPFVVLDKLGHFEFFGVIHFYVIMKIKSPFVGTDHNNFLWQRNSMVKFSKYIWWLHAQHITQPMSGVERFLAF